MAKDVSLLQASVTTRVGVIAQVNIENLWDGASREWPTTGSEDSCITKGREKKMKQESQAKWRGLNERPAWL